MRVLETEKVVSEMGKRRTKRQLREIDISIFPAVQSVTDNVYESDGAGCSSGCQHIKKGVNLNLIKRQWKQHIPTGKCQDCSDTKNVDDSNVDSSMWICLQCGHQGCGRSTKEQHALKHYKTPRSSAHVVVANSTLWLVWCYECDKEIPKESSRKLTECMDFLQKQFSSTPSTLEHAVTQLPEYVYSESESASQPVDSCSQLEQKIDGNNSGKKTAVSNAAIPKVKGLRNLGNTCFFNAVMQNLCHTRGLDSVLSDYLNKESVLKLCGKVLVDRTDGNREEHEIENGRTVLPELQLQLSESGTMTAALFSFLQDMNSPTKLLINPGILFGQVCKKAPRFKGFQQQDSHELLRQLLDGIKSEEIKRAQQAILKAFHVDSSGSMKHLDQETKLKIKEYGREVKHTFMDSLFGGHLISTVLCEQCHTPSQIFEPFLDLSLPLADERIGKNSKKSSTASECNGRKNLFEADNTERLSKHQEKRSKKQTRKDKKRTKGVKSASSTDIASNEDKLNNSRETGDTSKDSDGGASDCEECICSEINALHEDELQKALVEVIQSLENLNIHHEVGSLSYQSSVIQTCKSLRQNSQSDSECEKSGDDANAQPIIKCDILFPNSSYVEDDEKEKELNLRLLAMKPLMPLAENKTQNCSIYSCLQQFTEKETLADSNKFGCDLCTKNKYPGEEKTKTVYTNASKQMLIFSPPTVLTLHLKRFQQIGYSLRKNSRAVDFPLSLDLAPYCSSLCRGTEAAQQRIMYYLYGVVEHAGSLHGGHYTAYIKTRPNQGLFRKYMHSNGLEHEVSLTILIDQLNQIAEKNDHLMAPNNFDENIDTSSEKWFHISDTHVSECSESSVLRSQAYLLFYERVY